MGHTKEPSAYAVLNKSGSAIRIWWSGSERERAERIAAEDFDSKLTSLYSDNVLRDIEMQRDDLLAALEKLQRRLSACAEYFDGANESSIQSWLDMANIAISSVKESV